MTFTAQRSIRAIHAQRRTKFLTVLFGSIPLGVGKKLRQFLYRFVLGQVGKGVNIDPGLELVGAEGIHLGDQVSLARNIFLNCWNDSSRIILGDGVQLDQGIHLQALGGRIEIGEHTFIGPYFCAAGPGNITIGKNCLIASHSSAYANNHIFSDSQILIHAQGVTCEGIAIEDDCWLGTGVRVLDRVTIGQGSVIGAGAVVTKSIPPYSVAVGVPARVIDRRGTKQASLAA